MVIKATKLNIAKFYLAAALFFGASTHSFYSLIKNHDYNNYPALKQEIEYSMELSKLKCTLDPCKYSNLPWRTPLEGYRQRYSLRDLAENPNLEEEIINGKDLIRRESSLENKIDSLRKLPEFREERKEKHKRDIINLPIALLAGLVGLGSLIVGIAAHALYFDKKS